MDQKPIKIALAGLCSGKSDMRSMLLSMAKQRGLDIVFVGDGVCAQEEIKTPEDVFDIKKLTAPEKEYYIPSAKELRESGKPFYDKIAGKRKKK